jgi:hypothetical protein
MSPLSATMVFILLLPANRAIATPQTPSTSDHSDGVTRDPPSRPIDTPATASPALISNLDLTRLTLDAFLADPVIRIGAITNGPGRSSSVFITTRAAPAEDDGPGIDAFSILLPPSHPGETPRFEIVRLPMHAAAAMEDTLSPILSVARSAPSISDRSSRRWTSLDLDSLTRLNLPQIVSLGVLITALVAVAGFWLRHRATPEE